MDFQNNASDANFRAEVAEFIRTHLPPELAQRRKRVSYTGLLSRDDTLAWTAILAKRGWSVPSWPVEYGGQDWTPMQKFIFDEECQKADAPPLNGQATGLAAPIIYTFGSEEQKARFLPPIREGTTYWAQGFSEPGSGSDLASLRTAAVLDGDNYVVTGQKVWTSGAASSDWGFFLVRTDPDSQRGRGISFLLIDLKTPGVTIRRIPQINGNAHLCEVFLDQVVVPKENLVGEAGEGWGYAKVLLDNERTGSSAIFASKREVARLKDIVAARGGELPPSLRERIIEAEIQVKALEWSCLRVLANETPKFGKTAAASALKLRGATLQQTIMEIQVDLLGPQAARFFSPDAIFQPGNQEEWPDYVAGRVMSSLITRAASIFGGARQVQYNILAKAAFDLR